MKHNLENIDAKIEINYAVIQITSVSENLLPTNEQLIYDDKTIASPFNLNAILFFPQKIKSYTRKLSQE